MAGQVSGRSFFGGGLKAAEAGRFLEQVPKLLDEEYVSSAEKASFNYYYDETGLDWTVEQERPRVKDEGALSSSYFSCLFIY